MLSADDNITNHDMQTNPGDYQVNDVVRCVAPYPWLLLNNLYVVHAVRRRWMPAGIVSVVTVLAHGRVVEVRPAEPVLVPTRDNAPQNAADGSHATRTFPDREDLARWRAVARVARAHRLNHVVADRPRPGSARYTAMCVPGELADGADSTWFVYDLHARTSEKIGAGVEAQEVAGRMARTANRTWRAQQAAGSE